jgi:Ferritin-like domain
MGVLWVKQFDQDGAVEEAFERLPAHTRRVFLAAVAGGVGATATQVSRADAAALTKSDQAILNYALVLEYLQAAFYTEAERIGALHGPVKEQARVVGGHERAHVEAFRAVLGSSAVAEPKFNFKGVTESQPAFVRTAVAFEDLAVAAYKAQFPAIQARGVLASALSIHSVEARHAAWIRRLAGVVPAASAYDQPKGKAAVSAVVSSTHFIVSTTSGDKPRVTG